MAALQPVLIMIQGPEPGSFYKLPDNRVTAIGRSSRNTIRAVSPSVSRFHCEISCVNGRWELTDLNSKKGTIVNGRPIEGKYCLRAGDIIRVGAAVFRFDRMDETALQDGAMVAIMEAELDQKLVTKGEALGSLDDILARSRLEAEQAAQERRHERDALKTNLIFLGAVAAAVVIAVSAFLAYAHRSALGPQRQARDRQQRAEGLYADALADLKAGRRPDALQKLRALLDDYADTPVARDADATREDALWAVAQEKVALVTDREGDGDYAAALGVYDELTELAPDDLLKGLLAQRREYTVRLAHAFYKSLKQAAEERAAAGDARAALDLYRRARDRAGLPELVSEASARIEELQSAAPSDAEPPGMSLQRASPVNAALPGTSLQRASPAG